MHNIKTRYIYRAFNAIMHNNDGKKCRNNFLIGYFTGVFQGIIVTSYQNKVNELFSYILESY